MLETSIIRDHTGKPTGVVMSFEKFLNLAPLEAEAYLSDEELGRRVLAAHDPTEETWPHHVVERLVLGDETPLKVFREYRGFTQKELAERAGCSANYVSQLESGRKTMSRSLLRLIAGILDVDVEDLSPAPSPT